MADEIYAVGDTHGCLESLEGLLEQLPPDARLVFMGDIVNRGPHSLETARLVKGLQEAGRAVCLLGNHDLHLLAVASGNGAVHRRDTIGQILSAPDRDGIIEWLRRQRLAVHECGAFFSHAGAHPDWDLETALALAEEAEASLSGPGWKAYLKGMYGDSQWSPGLTGATRMRAILNSFTRQRFVKADGKLDFSSREGLKQASAGLTPWFEKKGRKMENILMVIGHWSVLGLMLRPNLIAVDTGCLWGGALTAVRLPDRKVFMEPCPLWCEPGK